jgi:hypothetical protein
MPSTEPGASLATSMVDWMAENRPLLDRFMSEEGSRAIHEEFILAEGGTLPDRATRIDRARGASARAWLRLLARALEETWQDAPPGLAAELERGGAAAGERREALELEETAIEERRGASGDPVDERRRIALRAHARLFAEIVGGQVGEDEGAGPELGRRVGSRLRADEGRLREIESEAAAAWSERDLDEDASTKPMTAARPEADPERIAEAAAVWAHVRLLAEALAAELAAAPGGEPA